MSRVRRTPRSAISERTVDQLRRELTALTLIQAGHVKDAQVVWRRLRAVLASVRRSEKR